MTTQAILTTDEARARALALHTGQSNVQTWPDTIVPCLCTWRAGNGTGTSSWRETGPQSPPRALVASPCRPSSAQQRRQPMLARICCTDRAQPKRFECTHRGSQSRVATGAATLVLRTEAAIAPQPAHMRHDAHHVSSRPGRAAGDADQPPLRCRANREICRPLCVNPTNNAKIIFWTNSSPDEPKVPKERSNLGLSNAPWK